MIACARIFILLLPALVLAGCGGRSSRDISRVTVLAPDYLEGILEPAAQQFESENGISVGIVYTAADSVVEQARHMPRIDVFITGGYKQFESLRRDSLLVRAGYYCPFRLSLVLAGRVGGPRTTTIDDLKRADFERVVIADPQAEYEGFLALEVLKKRRLWDRLQKKLIVARSTEHLRSFLDTREADAAILLESSLYGQKGLVVMQRLDKLVGDVLIQCGVVTAKSQNKKSAQAFLDLLGSQQCPIYKIDGVYLVNDR